MMDEVVIPQKPDVDLKADMYAPFLPDAMKEREQSTRKLGTRAGNGMGSRSNRPERVIVPSEPPRKSPKREELQMQPQKGMRIKLVTRFCRYLEIARDIVKSQEDVTTWSYTGLIAKLMERQPDAAGLIANLRGAYAPPPENHNGWLECTVMSPAGPVTVWTPPALNAMSGSLRSLQPGVPYDLSSRVSINAITELTACAVVLTAIPTFGSTMRTNTPLHVFTDFEWCLAECWFCDQTIFAEISNAAMFLQVEPIKKLLKRKLMFELGGATIREAIASIGAYDLHERINQIGHDANSGDVEADHRGIATLYADMERLSPNIKTVLGHV